MKQKLHVTSDGPLRWLNGRDHTPRDKTGTKPVPKSSIMTLQRAKGKVKPPVPAHENPDWNHTKVAQSFSEVLLGGDNISLLLCKRTEVGYKVHQIPKVAPLSAHPHHLLFRSCVSMTQDEAWIDLFRMESIWSHTSWVGTNMHVAPCEHFHFMQIWRSRRGRCGMQIWNWSDSAWHTVDTQHTLIN